MDEAAIIVNATACDAGGALTVLRQFLADIRHEGHKWIVFVSDRASLPATAPNVTLVPVHGVKSWFRRFRWDVVGLSRWLRRHHVKPIAKLSFQNTGFNVGADVPSFLYYHQPLPLYDYRWNPFNRLQRKMWFYKHIYPFFERLFLTDQTTVFVQLECIKERFARRFNHPADRIIVSAPTVSVLPIENVEKKSGISLIYPAADYCYKNHQVIIEALKLTAAPVEVIFTTSGLPDATDPRIRQTGNLSFKEVSSLYCSCDALLFPSYIETYGLPLVEAAQLGKPVLAADLPYAREVLAGYEGVTFISPTEPQAWADAINRVRKGAEYRAFTPNSTGWQPVFDAILKTL